MEREKERDRGWVGKVRERQAREMGRGWER